MLVNSTLMSSLADLGGVTDIDGFPTDAFNATLNVQQNTAMSALGLTHLVRLGGGTVYVRDNIGLCLQDTIDWAGLLYATATPTVVLPFTYNYLVSVLLLIESSSAFTPTQWTAAGYFEVPNCGLSLRAVLTRRPAFVRAAVRGARVLVRARVGLSALPRQHHAAQRRVRGVVQRKHD